MTRFTKTCLHLHDIALSPRKEDPAITNMTLVSMVRGSVITVLMSDEEELSDIGWHSWEL